MVDGSVGGFQVCGLYKKYSQCSGSLLSMMCLPKNLFEIEGGDVRAYASRWLPVAGGYLSNLRAQRTARTCQR
jgi:hypothetical protein